MDFGISDLTPQGAVTNAAISAGRLFRPEIEGALNEIPLVGDLITTDAESRAQREQQKMLEAVAEAQREAFEEQERRKAMAITQGAALQGRRSLFSILGSRQR